MDDDDIVLPEPVPTTSLAVALAPIGAVLRFHLSKLNGALTDDFPLGTFAVRCCWGSLGVQLTVS